MKEQLKKINKKKMHYFVFVSTKFIRNKNLKILINLRKSLIKKKIINNSFKLVNLNNHPNIILLIKKI